MDREEAARVLREQLQAYRAMTYEDLRARIGELSAYELASGKNTYQIEIQVVWDGAPGGNIRILGGIDDGGWSSFAPVTDDLLLTPEGAWLD